MKKRNDKKIAGQESKPASKIIEPHMLLILRVLEHPYSIYLIQLPVTCKIALVTHEITQYNWIINEISINKSTRLWQLV